MGGVHLSLADVRGVGCWVSDGRASTSFYRGENQGPESLWDLSKVSSGIWCCCC